MECLISAFQPNARCDIYSSTYPPRKRATLCIVSIFASVILLPPVITNEEFEKRIISWNFTGISLNKSKTIDISLHNPYIFEQLGLCRFRICKNKIVFTFFLEVPFFESHFLTPKLKQFFHFFTQLHCASLVLALWKKLVSEIASDRRYVDSCWKVHTFLQQTLVITHRSLKSL